VASVAKLNFRYICL